MTTKINFFLCALLLAGNVFTKEIEMEIDEQKISSNTEGKFTNIIDNVNNELTEVVNYFNKIEKILENKNYNIKIAAQNFKQNLSNRTIAKRIEVNRYIQLANKYNIKECNDIEYNFNEIVLKARSELSTCINYKLKNINYYMTKIKNNYNNAVKYLTNLKNTAENCLKYNNKFTSSKNALACSNMVADNEIVAAKEIVKNLHVRLENFKLNFNRFFTKLILCTAGEGVLKLEDDSNNVIDKIDECIKINKKNQMK
ncbi:protein PF3D7_1417600-like [Leptopilina boulardi]|uniref:protein PF3D7_1417600-like n=1 Tax=Leptopilina boulardi TaxID=63433 RepID=UPI0021F5DD42|nr:protein PF3D7_1417600-like [Leptopilina boulardi]